MTKTETELVDGLRAFLHFVEGNENVEYRATREAARTLVEKHTGKPYKGMSYDEFHTFTEPHFATLIERAKEKAAQQLRRKA